MEQKFFLYARKSTDVEDKQVLSIEAQLTELRIFAKQEHLSIVEEFVEKQSAKIPGRPIFNTMMSRIERGEATGIVTWNPDRLARNSIDGGKIIYMLDRGQMTALKSPQFWFENTPQGKFMLNIAFGQSKYYIDALSENTKRGIRQKIRRGEAPTLAPLGYINDVRLKSIVVDRKQSVVVRRAFELYAENRSCLEDISNFLAKNGIVSSQNNLMHRDRIAYILSNPFYVGLFRYKGEVYEGKHTPIISKQLFDQVQQILKERSRVHHTITKEQRALCGLLTCGTCGMGITGEYRQKRLAKRTIYYTYYHCTKKHKTIECNEPHIREEKLDEQLSKHLMDFVISPELIQGLQAKLEEDRISTSNSNKTLQNETDQAIRDIQIKVERLLDGYLAQDIEREVYIQKKADLLSQKKSLEEKRGRLEHRANVWLEPMENWLNKAEKVEKIALDSNLFEKKAMAKEIFGSNLFLTQKNVVVGHPKNVVDVVGQNVVSDQKNVVENVVFLSENIGQNVVETNQEQGPYPSENVVVYGIKQQWAALWAARRMVSKKPLRIVMVDVGGIEPPTLRM